jgi:hypothetical protein
MNHHSTGAPSKRGLMSMRSRLAVAPFLTASLLAGIVTASAGPALAAPLVPAPSEARAAGNAASRPAPLPRAFFGLGPANKTQIDGRPYFNWSVTPGAGLTDHVAFVNFGVTPVTLHVFVTNEVSTAQGGTGLLPEEQARGGPADWVTIHFPNGSSNLYLPPRSKVIVTITAVFPKNAPPGDHVGAIVASLTSVIQSKNRAKVHFVQQVAERIIARVSGRLRPQLSIVGLRVSYSDPVNPVATSPATMWFTVSNTGNELLGGQVSVSVHGLFGSTETRTNVVTIPPMLPSGSYDARVTVAGVYPELLMNAKVTVAPLGVTGQYDQGLTPYAGQASFIAIPWIPLAILILLVLLAVWIWLRPRRRRHRAAAAVPGGRSPVASASGGSASGGSASGASSTGGSASADRPAVDRAAE